MVAIHTPLQTTIVLDADAFLHEHADQLSRWVSRHNAARKIIIDLSRAQQASTSAFARLVLLRRALLKAGRDLRLINLRAQALALYQVNRLADVLPSA
jgi:ABC-type transporter Mla MlaB component